MYLKFINPCFNPSPLGLAFQEDLPNCSQPYVRIIPTKTDSISEYEYYYEYN